MCDDDTINNLSKVAAFRYQREIRKLSLIIISHMHTTIKHDVLSSYCDDNTAFSYFKSSSYDEKLKIKKNQKKD
mgnify:CR=1 FL=1